MKPRSLINLGIIGAAAGLLAECQSGNQKEKKQAPNVLFISIDDLRPELGCYGNNFIKTPNIDNFARDAVVFTRTYCQAAVSAPSRASLMTGLRPDSTRVWHLGDKFRKTIPDVLTMPQFFHQFGYYTVSLGKIFHNYMPDSVSWDEPDLRPAQYKKEGMLKRDGETFYYDKKIQELQKKLREEVIKKNPNVYADGWNCGPAVECSDAPDNAFYDGAQTDLAIKTLKRIKNKKQPFYMAIGYYRPHLPFVVPKKYWELYNRNDIPVPDNQYLPENSPIWAINSMYELRGYTGFKHIKHPSQYMFSEDTIRLLKHGYYASVSYVDACVGKLLKELKQMDLYDNTIIIIWGDHGWKLGEHNSWCKQTNYEIDTHVPMIIYSPEINTGGTRCDKLTELVDIFPTLCDLADIKVPSYLQGTSVVPLMKNPDLQWKSAVFSQFHRRPRITPDGKRYMGYSMRTEQYHYIEWYYWDNINKVARELTGTELYDHKTDPDENVNINSSEKNQEVMKELSQQLRNGWRSAKPTGF